MAKVSVVVPMYNAAATVARTLESVRRQTFQDFEVVVVDDGSTDNSVAVVEALGFPNLRVVRQQNGGVSAARNRGIAEACGEFVALLDSDDLWKPDYLVTQMDLARRYPQCDVFAVDYEFHKADGSVAKTVISKLPFEGEDGELTNYFQVASCSHPPICSISIMARKEAFEAVGGFPLGIKSGEDLLTWARLAARYRIAYSRKALAEFYVEGYGIKERPKRVPQVPDVVGEELAKLEAPGIRLYRAHWHRMRGNVYMRLRERRKSLGEIGKSLRLNPWVWKVWAIGAMNFLKPPGPLKGG